MRILMIEDDKAFCKVVALQLKACGYVTDLCHDGEEGLYCAEQGGYDLILLDRMLPGLDGMRVLSQLRRKEIHTPVLMLTAMNGVTDRVDGLDEGADDYLTKPFAMEELLARVRALLRRTPKIDSESGLSWADARLDMAKRLLCGPAGETVLAKKEAALLEILLHNPERPLTRGQLFAHIWGPSATVDDANLDRYVHFIRRRLAGVGSRLQIKTVWGAGYMLEDNQC